MKRCPIGKSALFRLKSKKKLADYLELTPKELEDIANLDREAYQYFTIRKVEGNAVKTREISAPVRGLSRVQKRIANLLGRIECPVYLCSTYSGTSYVKNAQQHDAHDRVAKIDIRKFFPSVRAYYVRKCFLEVFQCSEDVAALLVKLTTLSNRLPTGGNSSPMIAFWAYKPMFDEIYRLAETHGIKMTCYVDDLTFSGQHATKNFLFQVRNIISGYQLKAHKRKLGRATVPKLITGVVQTTKGSRLPNNRRDLLKKTWEEFTEESDSQKRDKIGKQLWGRAVEAGKIEKKYNGLLIPLKKLVFNQPQRNHEKSPAKPKTVQPNPSPLPQAR